MFTASFGGGLGVSLPNFGLPAPGVFDPLFISPIIDYFKFRRYPNETIEIQFT